MTTAASKAISAQNTFTDAVRFQGDFNIRVEFEMSMDRFNDPGNGPGLQYGWRPAAEIKGIEDLINMAGQLDLAFKSFQKRRHTGMVNP